MVCKTHKQPYILMKIQSCGSKCCLATKHNSPAKTFILDNLATLLLYLLLSKAYPVLTISISFLHFQDWIHKRSTFQLRFSSLFKFNHLAYRFQPHFTSPFYLQHSQTLNQLLRCSIHQLKLCLSFTNGIPRSHSSSTFYLSNRHALLT